MPDKEEKKALEEEDVISNAIGEYGRWQFMLTFLLSLVNIPCTWHIFVPVFHSAERPTWCSRQKRFKDISPQLWKNCTDQEDDFCYFLDVFKSNVTDAKFGAVCHDMSGLDRAKCSSWEFGGEGNYQFTYTLLVFNRP